MTKPPEDYEQLDHLQRAALALKRMRAKLDTLERAKTEPIAIIGMGCRLPGVADNICGPEAFWSLLHAGGDAISEIPAERWDVDSYYDPDPNVPAKMHTRWGGFLRDIDSFDAHLFGIAPREAVSMDPQQRILLEVAWEALEHAGQAPDALKKTKTGVFVGIGIGDYAQMQMSPDNAPAIDAYTGTGNGFCFASGRLSYILGAQGPSLSIDTACSSSLVAIHLACQSLRNQECSIALAGGVNAMLAPEAMLFLAKSRALSPTGRCRTFDAAADGFVRGEGCGVIVLKRLSDAIADGDTILAVLRGSAINHDGPSSGLTVPNGHAQRQLLRQVLEQAQVTPAQIGYVEAHGTGTSLGDPIELRALGEVLGEGRARENPLLVGSVKTNIGHLEAAAGVVGVIKVVLTLQHEMIPPHLHFRTPTPHLNWDELPVTIPTSLTPWSVEPSQQRVAGVSSFGLSGTNAHVILGQAPPHDRSMEGSVEGPQVLCLSAKSAPALQALAARYAQHLTDHPSLSLSDLCFTTNTGRAYLTHHLATVADSREQLYRQLTDFCAEREAPGLVSGERQGSRRPKIAFLCTGQGSQYPGMGRQLYATEPVFRQWIDRCNEIVAPHLGQSLLSVLYPDSADTSAIHETLYTQPALVALEYALAQLWRSWGMTPSVLLGHSVGEYAAACIAGIFSLEDGLRLVVERARLMQALPHGGGMVAVYAPAEQVRASIQPYGAALGIAALNGPQHVVISGGHEALKAATEQFDAAGIRTRRLMVSTAFHSPLLQPMLADFARAARSVRYNPPQIDIITNLTGDLAPERIATPDYWIDHILQPVQFAAGVQTLQQRGYEICIEIGPQPVLTEMARQSSPLDSQTAQPMRWLSSLRRNTADRQHILSSLAALHAHGVQVDWPSFYQPQPHRKIELPTYPFQRQRYWAAPVRRTEQADHHSNQPQREGQPLPGQRVFSAAFTRGEIQFEIQLDRQTPELLQHDPAAQTLRLPDTTYVEIAVATGVAVLSGQQVIIEELLIQQELSFPDTQTRTLHILLTPTALEAYDFQVLSLAAQASPLPPTWTCHAAGRLSRGEPRVPAAQPGLAALQAALTEPGPIRTAARLTQTIGTTPAMIEQMYRSGTEVLCQVALPDLPARDVTMFWMHPQLLDACWQSIGAALSDGQEQPYLPVGVAHLALLGRAQRRIWCHALTVQPANEQLVVNVRIFDEVGGVIAEIMGLSLRHAAPAPVIQNDRPQWEQWLYQPAWQPSTHPATPAAPDAITAWLILADDGGIGRALAEQLRDQAAHCTLVFAGDGYSQLAADEYVVDPAAPSDVQRLIEAWHGNQHAARCGVVHLWSLDTSSAVEMTTEAVQHLHDRLCGSALHLVQALIGADRTASRRVWFVTRGSQAVDPESIADPHQRPLWGLSATIALEHPELRCVCLDLDRDEQHTAAATVLTELTAPDDEQQIAFRHGTRYVARLKRYAAAQHDGDSTRSVTIRSDGTYLITGGLGGLGLRVARWMATQGAGAVVLLGRGAVPVTAQTTLAALEQTGTRILTAQVDVANTVAVAAMLEQIGSEMPPLRGIVHAAGVLDDGTLTQQTWERFRKVLAPKVAGAWNLHTLTTQLPLDFFICFSSIASQLGSPGQSSYTTANAFLDGLTHYRRSRGLPAMTINWGPWSEVGMEITNLGRRAAQGLEMIAPEQGIDILSYLTQHPAAQACVLPVRWEQFLSQLPPGSHRPFFEAFQPNHRTAPGLREQLATVPVNERRAWLATRICSITALVLGEGSARQITPRTGLFELGLDSLMALDLKNRLEASMGCLLRQTFVFDYPMVDAMVDYFSRDVFPELFPTQPSQHDLHPAEAPQIAELALLSEEEAEALLLEQLDQMKR